MKTDFVQEILKKGIKGLDLLNETLDQENIGSVYARNTKINRIRNSVMDSMPVFLNIGSNVMAVVGESEDSLVLLDQSGLYATVPDSVMEKKWNGEAVFVTGAEPPKAVIPKIQTIVYDPIKSDWDAVQNEKLFSVLKILSGLDTIDKCYIPQSSVILNAKKPDKEERKDHQVAYSIGVNITVLLSDNLLEAILHELGHVYWNTLLTDSEKYEWNDMVRHISLKEGRTVPKIIKNPYEVSSGEELYCTVYAWYLSGLIFNEGYLKILTDAFKEGRVLMDSTFERVRKSLINDKAYEQSEPLIKQYLKTIRKESIIVNTQNNKLFKAQLSLNKIEEIENSISIFGSSTPVGLLKSSLRHSHFQVLDGKLKDYVFITNNITGNIDWDFMKEHPSELKSSGRLEFDPTNSKIIRYGNNPITLCKAKGRKLPEPMKIVKTEEGSQIVFSSWRKQYEGPEITTDIKQSPNELLKKANSFLSWFTK